MSYCLSRPKPRVRRRHLRDISYTGRVIADFVSNFFAIATGVGRGRIFLAPFNRATPKTPCWTQRCPRYRVHKPTYSRFCLKFRCHCNGDGRGRICLASFNSPNPKPPCYTQRSRGCLVHKPSYSRFCIKFCYHGNEGWSQ